MQPQRRFWKSLTANEREAEGITVGWAGILWNGGVAWGCCCICVSIWRLQLSLSLHPLEINPYYKDMWSQWSRETIHIFITQRNYWPGAVTATIFPSIYWFLCLKTCISVDFSLYRVTPFSESWKCGQGVFWEWAEQENTTRSLKSGLVGLVHSDREK